MQISYTKKIAIAIADDHQWLIGSKYIAPYEGCSIEFIEPEKLPNGSYRVIVGFSAFSKNSIPEFFEFKDQKCDLVSYFNIKKIFFDVNKYKSL